MPKHRHRRVILTPEIGEAILRRIAEGEPLLRICGPNRAAGMPDRMTVYQRLMKDEGFRAAYLVARQMQADLYAEQIIEIADGRGLEGDVEGPGGERDVRRDWMRMSARRWVAGVTASRTFGGRGLFEGAFIAAGAGGAGGADGGGLSGGEDDALVAARIAAILEAARARRAVTQGRGALGGDADASSGSLGAAPSPARGEGDLVG